MKKLEKYLKDLNYYHLISDILDNNKFKKLANNRHHGITRLEHSIKVSYNSYKVAKKMHLNYREVARAGLLHDFFINEDLSTTKQKYSMFFHPYYSLENACKYFDLNDKHRLNQIILVYYLLL